MSAEKQAGVGIEITYVAGNCPVQGEGTFDGEPFYFRARGTQVTVDVGEWEWRGPEYEWPFAGWISEGLARAYIREAYREWLHRHDGRAHAVQELRRRNDAMDRHMSAVNWAVWLERNVGKEAASAVEALLAHASEVIKPVNEYARQLTPEPEDES